MKKNLLATLLLSSAMFVGLNRVNAEELKSVDFDLNQKNYTLNSADKYGVKSIPYFGNSLIIGERIYTLNSYFVSAYEVRSAVDAYRTAHSGSLDTPLYYLAGNGTDINALYEITDGYDGEGQLKLKLVDLETVFVGKKMSKVTAINDVPVDYTAEDIIKTDEDTVSEILSEETDLTEAGLESVTFENRKLTVEIGADSLSTNLTQARNKVTEIIHELMSNDVITGVYSVSYKGTTVKLSDLDDTAINEFAKNLLKDLSQSEKAPKDLIYEDIANRSATIQVTYIKDGLNLGTIDYEVSFEYDVQNIVEKNETVLTETANGLLASTVNENLKNAFSKVEYKDHILTFEVKDGSVDVTTLNNTNFINMFLENYKGAKKIEVTAGNTTETFTIPTDEELDAGTVYTWIIKVLEDMSGKTILETAAISDSETIKLSDLINKEAKATVTYDVNGKTAIETYTLKFTPDYSKVDAAIESVKSKIPSIVEDAKKKIGEGKGISSVEQNDTTVTFVINDGSKDATQLAGLGLTDVIKGMFTNATYVTYTIHNEHHSDITKEHSIGTDEEQFESDIDDIKQQLKVALGNSANYVEEGESDATLHTLLKDYVKCSIDVTVTYTVDGLSKTQNYQIKFEQSDDYTDGTLTD